MAEQPEVGRIIRELGLEPLPIEGGFYAVSYRSDEMLSESALPERYNNAHPYGGAIYFLTTAVDFSAMHRLTTDEVYYFHGGDPLQMLFLFEDGSSETRILGLDLGAGHRPQTVAQRGQWHGARPLPGGAHGYSLGGTSMAPGYIDDDVEFADRAVLIAQFPQHRSLITALTRLPAEQD